MTPITTEPRTELERQAESPAGAGAGASSRTQPVSIEIPVLVRGSRRVASVPGQPGKLEHFSEETTTVVVFAQGAVVRLVGSAKAGQLVGLTNRQTGKEALCRIVNIKHFPDTRGYVEIEFNHPMNGFWQSALPQEAPAPSVPKKNVSSSLDALAEMSAEQLRRANPKELKAQLLEMAAQLKDSASDESHGPSAVPATPQDFWKNSAALRVPQSTALREQDASEDARVGPTAQSSELAVENSEAAAPVTGIAPVNEVGSEPAGLSSPEADLEVSEIGVSEFELAADANNAAVTSDDPSVAAETEQENAQASSPAGEWLLSSPAESLAAQPEISPDSSQGTASFAVDAPPPASDELDAELESLLQRLDGLAEPSVEVIFAEAQSREPSSTSETYPEVHQPAVASSPELLASEESEQAAPPAENLERDDLSPEDMWNAGSIIHSNLDRPSAGSSDADMRASEEKTAENTRMAELKAALVTPSAEAAMREDGSLSAAPGPESPNQPLSLESVWSLFRSLNKSVPSTPETPEEEAASFKLFASGAISDARKLDTDAVHLAESAASNAAVPNQAGDLGRAGKKEDSDEETEARGKVSEAAESADRSESDEECAADQHARDAASARNEDSADEDEAADDDNDDGDHEDSPPRSSAQEPKRPDIVPQWYSTTASAASKPWTTPGSTGLSLSGAQGTMATTSAPRSSGAKSILAHAAATLVLLAAGAAAFHTLRPSVSYLMKPPTPPPAVDPDENAAARDAAVASLTVPPLPADIQARLPKSAQADNAKSGGAPGSSGAVPVPAPGDTSAPLRVGEGVNAPRLLTKTSPIVSEAVLASGISGDVVLSVVVDNTGRVATARVVSGPGTLRNAALEAVRQWAYEPALQDGRPVAVQIYVTVKFPRH